MQIVDARAFHVTPRQREVALMVAKGFSNEEIARAMNIKRSTVEKHLGSLYRELGELGVRARAELINFVREGSLQPPITLFDGQVISGEHLPLSFVVTGEQVNGQLWAVLEDAGKRFYLQNPPAKLLPDGNLLCRNVLPGCGIKRIDLVDVGIEGQKSFGHMVDQWAFDAFTELPNDARVLLSITIQRKC